ncbi:MAG: hypothetical protein J0M08_05875 [Bacteroidetes bacterium]|nr:hypothetical protein [Bacteroidota bacterium]
MKNEQELKYQHRFIESLKLSVSDNISLADELSDILGLSTDSIYRRLRCETAISIDEMALIARKFKLNLVELLREDGNNNSVSFNYTSLYHNPELLKQHFKNMLSQLRGCAESNEKHIYYAAHEMPLFYYFQFPELTAYKLFYWRKTVLGVPAYDKMLFDASDLEPEINEICHNIYTTYKRCPATEIWTPESINTIYTQITFYLESFLFKNRAIAEKIIQQTIQMIETIEQAAIHSNKANPDKAPVEYNLYLSNINLTGILIYSEFDSQRIAVHSFNSINSLTTFHAGYTKEAESWIKNTIKKSSLISGIAERDRNQFFNQIKRKLNQLLEQAQNY